MPWAQRVNTEESRNRSEQEGREVVVPDWYWDDRDGAEPYDPAVHPGLVLTGPAAGTVILSDGTAVDVTPQVVELHRDQHAELARHLEDMHRQSGYLPPE